jgi:hypothetical protein
MRNTRKSPRRDLDVGKRWRRFLLESAHDEPPSGEELDHAADAVLAVHELEPVIDLLER